MKKQSFKILILIVLSILVLLGIVYVVKHNTRYTENFNDYKQNLDYIHTKLKLNHGSLSDEYPEQLLSVRYISPTDSVLEIGGNIGRNSCIIAHILNDSNNLLVIESDIENVDKLKENRDINGFKFHIEGCAISNVDLYQQHWTTKPVNEIADIHNWKKINTKPWSEIKDKYNINFNVLVADCEGALYYILKENPNFLNSFNKVIIENDFTDVSHKEYVDSEFKKYNLQRVYSERLGWEGMPCSEYFYEVWTKL